MARRGSFGRSPRPAASLTNTIIAIAREMQQQEDQNIVNAWQKGGLYQGHKVTDQMILDHWKQRANSVSKKDPMYDMYNNAHMEYDYSIHESKVQTAYAQGKMSDAQAAAFYTGWAKKVPKNSEFWRVLQRDAAQFTRAAKAKSDAQKKAEAELRYQNNLKAIYNNQIAGGEYLQNVLTNLARRGIRPAGGNPLVDPMTGELYQMDAGDVEDMLGMVNRLTEPKYTEVEGPNGKGTTPDFMGAGTTATGRVLYHDPITDAPVTGQDILKKLQGYGFKGTTLTLDGLYDLITKQKAGLAASERAAASTGHLSDASRFRNQQATLAEVGREIKAWPVEQVYLDYHQKYIQVLSDRTSSLQDISDAHDAYVASLTKLTHDPAVAANDVFLNKLNGEINGDAGTTTLAEDFTGLNQVSPTDTAKNLQVVERAKQGLEDVASGKAVLVTGEWDNATNTFKPGAGGNTIGPASIYDIHNNAGGIPSQTVYLPDHNGRYQPVQIMGTPLNVVATDAMGNVLHTDGKGSPTVGYIYDFPDGTKQLTYKDGHGGTLVTNLTDGNAPWGQNATFTDDGKAYTLTIHAPTTQDGLANSGFKTVTNGSQKPEIVYNPYAAMLGTADADHRTLILSGTGDQSTDFRSANVAYYNSGTKPDGQKDLYQLGKNQDFVKQIETDTRLATGYTPQTDPKTGDIIWTGGNQDQFDHASQVNSAATIPGYQPPKPDRSSPASDLAPGHMEGALGYPGYDVNSPNPYGDNTDMGKLWAEGYRPGTPPAPLATSSLPGPVGQPFQNGTLNFDHGWSGVNDAPSIGLSGQIKVPNVPGAGSGTPFTPLGANVQSVSVGGQGVTGVSMPKPSPAPTNGPYNRAL